MDVRIIQDDQVYENRTSALIKLNITPIEPGVAYSFRYRTNMGDDKIDTLFALGVASGQGPSCYSLVSDQSIPVVADIVKEYPDISQVLYGEVYLLVESISGGEEENEENDLIINTLEEEVHEYYFLAINNDLSFTKTKINYCMYFHCNRNKKIYYLDPDLDYLVEVSVNIQGLQGITERLDAIESKIMRVSVRGNTLVFL